MRSLLVLTVLLAACGGEEKKPAPPPEAPKAEAPKVEPPPVAPPPAATPAPAAAGPYTPDDLAKAAYEKAKVNADKKNPKAGDAAAVAAGKATYEAKCAMCHGAGGAGDGVAGGALPQKPANFTWKERWDATSVGTKHWIVMNGIQGTAMATLGLTDDQAWEVLAYIEGTYAPK